MIKFLFFQFRITYLNLKNIELHFELLTQSRLMLEIQFYFCPLHLDVHQGKTTLFGHPLYRNYLYIIISYCFQPLFSNPFRIYYLPENLGQKIELSMFLCRKQWLSNQLMLCLIN